MSEKYEIPLAPEADWEDALENVGKSDTLSDLALSYLEQMKDLQQQLQLEYLKLQRLEMAIKGFSMSLQEELKKEVK